MSLPFGKLSAILESGRAGIIDSLLVAKFRRKRETMKIQDLKQLMGSLSLHEKIGQLVQLDGGFFGAEEVPTGPCDEMGIAPWVVENAGSVLNVLGVKKVQEVQRHHLLHSRIPLLFMADVVYGYKTSYPIPLALACSWDMELVEECAKNTAYEAAADGAQVTFSPMVDVVRDARWGRCLESPGEDPYLNSRFARAMVKGFQNDFTPGKSMASCVKHYAGYGAVEAGREYNTVDMSRWRLMQEYLPPYQAAVDADCKMVMTSFNTVEGIPSTANQWLMQDVLRKKWGFDGVVITDYAAIQELVAHGVAENDADAAKLAMDAGVDIDMRTPCYPNHLEELLKQGAISQEQIDQAVWRILTLKNELGLFEDPYRGVHLVTEMERISYRQLARKAAQESMVLLQNRKDVLPIRKGEKVALIGPYADSNELNGIWAIYADRKQVVTLKTAFAERLDAEHLRSTAGCELMDDYTPLMNLGAGVHKILEDSPEEELRRSIELAKWADVVVFAVGEHKLQSGESGSRTDISLPAIQQQWMEQILPYAKKSVVLLFNGRPLELAKLSAETDAILECWFPGTEGARAIVDLLMGDVAPSGKLTMSFPYHVGQEPLYYAQFNTGRPAGKNSTERFVSRYLDCPNGALFPFGHGLSYHKTVYSGLRLSDTVLHSGGVITAQVNVQNTGDIAGDEVVQLYICDRVGSVVRPVQELKGFQRIHLEPKECRTVTFEITEDMLKFYNAALEYTVEPGMFDVMVGPSSVDVLSAEFQKN